MSIGASANLVFTENKGQVHDQFFKSRPDVLFTTNVDGSTCHLLKTGLSYQFSKYYEHEVEETNLSRLRKKSVVDSFEITRLDFKWLQANSEPISDPENPTIGIDNFYSPSCGEGALGVKSYKGVRLRSIYPGVDIHLYSESGHLKYDFEIQPHSDYRKIRILISGSRKIEVQPNGNLRIHTALGDLEEDAPSVYQRGKQLKAKWKIFGDTLMFDVEGYDPTTNLLIDPIVRQWATYYGGSGQDDPGSIKRDQAGNVYLCGTTTSSSLIATVGAHQTVFAGGVNSTGDAYVVKFNSLGVRQWATYYGGYGTETGNACAVDLNGNVYLTGYSNTGYSTNPGTIIATASAYISTYTTGTNGYLVKFDNMGVRQWGTYCYGEPVACVTDQSNNVFIGGNFNANFSGSGATLLPTPGAHQTVFGGGQDGFITEFSPSGTRLWSTFYGGYGNEVITSLAFDGQNNLFASGHGWTNIGTSIATPGSHQFVFGGFNGDAFLVKFNSALIRQWGTYYGATDYDYGWCCCTDPQGNVYLAGTQVNYYYPYSGTLIATPGSHQPTIGGGASDAYLVKFNSVGVRQWATYYGGSTYDEGISCFTDNFGNVYLGGISNSTNSISSPGSYQATFAGGFDGFVAKFDGNGNRKWGTYYGDAGDEYARSGFCTQQLDIYFSGPSNSTVSIASLGSHQQNFNGGNNDEYIAKFKECFMPSAPVNITPVNNTTLCSTNTTTLFAQSNGNITWYTSPTGTNSVAFGAVFITPTLAPGTYSYYAEASLCSDSVNINRTLITVIVNANVPPVITANTGSICSGSSFTIIPSGATSYTIQGGSYVVSPFYTTSYMIWGTSSLGCVSSTFGICTVTVSPTPTITANSGNLCSGSSYTINPNGAFTYTISGGNFVVAPTVNTSYSITGTNSAGCVASNTAVANVNVVPVPTLVATGGTVCSGNTIAIVPTYTLVNNVLYVAITGNTFVVSPTVTTNYTVTITDGVSFCSVSSVATVVVVSGQGPSISVSGGIICEGQSFTLNPTGALSYTVLGASLVVTPSITTTYTVIGSNSLGCVSASTAICQVSVSPAPSLLANSGVICAGQQFSFNPIGVITYTISGGSPVVSPSATTVYSVTGTGTNGCNTPIPVLSTVFVIPLPTVSVNSGSICVGQNFTIQATGANNYTYSAGPVLMAPLNSMTFAVSGSSFGCNSASPGIGTLAVFPTPTITVSSGSICSGQNYSIQAGGANTYTYSSGPVLITPAANMTFSVAGSSFGCTSTSPAVGSLSVYPTPTITSNSGSICNGQSFTISPSGASQYSYPGGGPVVSPFQNSVYQVIGVNGIGNCSASVQSTVTVNPLPTLSISGSFSVICAGQSAILQASGASSYSWSTGFTGTTFVFAPVQSTIISVMGTNTFGCPGSATFQLFVDPCTNLKDIGTQSSEIVIYPNPSQGRIWIQTPDVLKEKALSLYNELGQIILRIQLKTNLEEVNFETLADGVYTVRIDQGNLILHLDRLVLHH